MRLKPYTIDGMRRVKCCRCGARAETQWEICADGNQYRPLCLSCDIALNNLVLQFMGFSDADAKMAAYRRKMQGDDSDEKNS